MNLPDLRAPFAPEIVKWRVDKTNPDRTRGIVFCYIDARDVMDRLDEVCGPECWQSEFRGVNGRMICSIGIMCSDWVWKSDGAGDTQFEPEKGGLSDAFKRAAVHWGIGRYLYDIPAPWVETEPTGLKGAKIKDHELPKLRAMLEARLPGRGGTASERKGNGGQQPAPKPSPSPTGFQEPLGGMIIDMHLVDRFKQNLSKLDSIAELAEQDAWFHKHGKKTFGPFAPELARMLQARVDEIRGAE